jgi:hypothetical protein
MGRYSIGVDIGGSKVPAQAELKCHGLGRFVLSTVKEKFFRAEKIICRECGSLLEVNIKKA